MPDDRDFCAECDVPIPVRPEFAYPSARWRFCGPCRSWRAKNLIDPSRVGDQMIAASDMVVRATQEFYRRNCVEV